MEGVQETWDSWSSENLCDSIFNRAQQDRASVFDLDPLKIPALIKCVIKTFCEIRAVPAAFLPVTPQGFSLFSGIQKGM